jgi:hypothetical protein
MKLGWHNETLYLEVHPNSAQQLELEEKGKFSPGRVPELIYRVVEAAGNARKQIDWKRVHEAVAKRSGMPIPILSTS